MVTWLGDIWLSCVRSSSGSSRAGHGRRRGRRRVDGPGLLVYLGVTHADGPDEVAWLARKIWELRLLRDEQSASDVGAPILVVSQFTLYGDARKGRRPDLAGRRTRRRSPSPLYDAVCAELERLGAHVERGVFGADMRVESVNDGPITVLLETD